MPELSQPPSIRDLRVTRGLTWIADRLASTHPGFTMTTTDRESTAREYVHTHYRDDRAANSAMWDLRDALPAILPGDTHDEYAARIRLHIQEVSA
ncbi:hypothetical protein ACFV5J_25035 [Streptomyces zaomyceticus]|uniref:hypothetical protein n=1 Tax=Streptomyces zaomyceticus TaxID=68286 RepID=UPI00365E22C1